MCHHLCDHATATKLATDTDFWIHKSAPQAHIYLREKKQIQKTIFAPKAHLHSSAKVRYLDFCVSAYSTDGDELQSDQMSGRPAPQTTSTAPQPCPTPTASSATFKLRARPHTAELPTIILGDGHGFWEPQKCAAGAFFSKRKKTNPKNNFRAEGALTFECQSTVP